MWRSNFIRSFLMGICLCMGLQCVICMHGNLHWVHCFCSPGGGGDSAGPRTPTTLPPPPPPGAFGQQLVAKGVALRHPWAPKAPDAP